MRGAGLFIFASALTSIIACAAPSVSHPVPAPSVAVADPDFRLDPPEPRLPSDPLPGGALPKEPAPGVVQTRAEAPPKREAAFDDVLRLQKEVAARQPSSEDEKFRLALLQASAGNYEEAERLLSTLKSRGQKFAPYLDLYLRRQLGDHKEAGRLIAALDEEERSVTGFVIERAELVAQVRRFRAYTAAESDRVLPGSEIHLYVEPRNFNLQRSGERHTFHLRYEWKLIDDRGLEQAVPAWDNAKLEDREDRITTTGPVSEFYQSFHLPLPANLAMGRYRVRILVTDVHTGKSDRAFIPIYVSAVEKAR